MKKQHRMNGHTRQQFQQVPYKKLLNMLKYKCERAGVIYKEINEDHTSKCDALASESIEHHDKYLGSRTKRGLFKSSVGKVLNADINGALNILRRIAGDGYVLENIIKKNLMCRPIRLNNLPNISLKRLEDELKV